MKKSTLTIYIVLGLTLIVGAIIYFKAMEPRIYSVPDSLVPGNPGVSTTSDGI